MNARTEVFPLMDTPYYLFASADGASISWLTAALGPDGRVAAVSPDAGALDERIAALAPLAVFVDFSGLRGSAAGDLHKRLKQDWPHLPVLAAGQASDPATMLAALRAGVDDFVDLQGASADALQTLRTLLERRSQLQAGTRGCTVALLGARAGLGVTTLAASLALTLQDLGNQRAPARMPPGGLARHGTALLDLGLPARDGLLYLDIPSSFSFIDGVRNLRRLDQTLLHTALAQHAGGVSVLPLPASLAQIREISHADSVALVRRLGDFFDFQVADLGGFSSIDFVAETARAADRTCIVCDQSTGGIVSTASLIAELRTRGLEPGQFCLVVNRFDSRAGLSARDIAERLQLPLAHVVPMRSTQLLDAASRGDMLVRSAPGDPYSQAVQAIARSLQQAFMAPPGQPPAKDARWSALMSQITGGWNRSREG